MNWISVVDIISASEPSLLTPASLRNRVRLEHQLGLVFFFEIVRRRLVAVLDLLRISLSCPPEDVTLIID
jgi:hypothetical protein